MSRWLALALAFSLSGCNCGKVRLDESDACALNPDACSDGGVILASDAGPQACDVGAISGRVCAPDQQTWVNGATVSVSATDCNGQPVVVRATSAADGSFSLSGVPVGSWQVHATLGAFTQDTPVAVTANATTAIPDNQLCVAQKTVKIAVVTGPGDQIENLLTSLQLQFTSYGGDSSTWASQAEPFLSDLSQMKQYDLIFIDCGAARLSGQDDFGSNKATIEQNLHDYVIQGGSLYASDWALLFATYAQPGAFDFATSSGSAVTDPLDTQQLMGFAPQSISGTVNDADLATFLGKSNVTISFPKQSGVSSLHWGLMQTVDPSVQVLVSAPSVQVCDGSGGCSSAGGTATNVPLAAMLKVTPVGTRGGNVVYTSFHNIAQSGTDVAQILKYLVLHL